MLDFEIEVQTLEKSWLTQDQKNNKYNINKYNININKHPVEVFICSNPETADLAESYPEIVERVVSWLSKKAKFFNPKHIISTFKKFIENHLNNTASVELTALAIEWPTQYQEVMAWAVNAKTYPNDHQKLTVLKRAIANAQVEPDESEPETEANAIRERNPEAFWRACDWANHAPRRPNAYQFLAALKKVVVYQKSLWLSIFNT